MLVRTWEEQDIQVKACISILLLLTGTVPSQAVSGLEEVTGIPWQPFKMQFPRVAPPPTIPKEMVSHLTVANWPITLETTSLSDAQRRFAGSIGKVVMQENSFNGSASSSAMLRMGGCCGSRAE
jgi:hypothetical protein